MASPLASILTSLSASDAVSHLVAGSFSLVTSVQRHLQHMSCGARTLAFTCACAEEALTPVYTKVTNSVREGVRLQMEADLALSRPTIN